MENGVILSALLLLKKFVRSSLLVRVCGATGLLLGWGTSVNAGEIVVYTQIWKGKEPASYSSKHKGKGYILIDFESRSVTRISSEVASYQKIFRIENYTSPVIATFTERPSGRECVAIQATRREEGSGRVWERMLFFKGKTSLQHIGPSQQKRVPKLISGLRRMTQDFIYASSIEEDSFSATFSKAITADANANSRTLQQQVDLLAESLVQAGYRRTGIE